MAQGGRDRRIEKLRVEYARWLLLDQVTRKSNGLPTSNAEWGRVKEISPRSLRRWRNDDPSFAELLEEEERKAAGRVPGGTIRRVGLGDEPGDEVADVEEARARGVTDPEELEYLRVKAAIRDKAMEADRSSLELYMKHWGHEFAEREREQRGQGFAHLSDDELVAEIRGLLEVLDA